MASSGHLLVPKAMRLIKFVVERTGRVIRDKLPQVAKSIEAELQPAYARIPVKQPISRAAAIRQNQSRWYSTKQAINNTVRHLSSTSAPAKASRSSYPSSRTGFAVSQLTSRSPFASTLRPNLTGGSLSRSAGGYGTGAGRVGGPRYFSHTPAAPAQVVNNVSQAVRAFWLSGQKARFDGMDASTGEKRFRAISTLQEETGRKMNLSNVQAPGSYLDFKVNPTITAIGPLSNIPQSSVSTDCDNLNTDGLMSTLSVDFARALKDLAAIMNDLKRLATLGELPISLADSTTLRVRFPGCDADSVEALCLELGIRRGLVFQDQDFDTYNRTDMALLFPFAPSKAPSEAAYSSGVRAAKRQRHKPEDVEWAGMMSPALQKSLGYSHRSVTSHDFEEIEANPWLSSPSGYESLHASENEDVGAFFESSPARNASHAEEYEGLEGIYKFLEECDRAKR